MNRNNIWIHICIAVVIITFAAVLGQIRRWQMSPGFRTERPNVERQTQKPTTIRRSNTESEPEVLVKFRPNVSLADIKKLAAKNNDRIEDEVEVVKGLISIDDLDNADAKTVAEQYSKMTDLVLYAEPNFQIKLSDPANTASTKDLLLRDNNLDEKLPNDPMFNEQWALSNTGQNGGKAKADVSALKAWLKTQGSEKIVVAVLDTGVDYTHTDLVENIWFRPDNIPQYKDDELGTFNDLRGFNGVNNQEDPMDENGHGTHCAGIIGAEGDNNEGIAGINWKVQIMPLKFLGKGGFGTTKDAIEAINYAIDRKRNGVNLKVISASWG
jgi:subtilisin family serine protease